MSASTATITLPHNTVVNKGNVGPWMQLHGSCTGPNPASWRVVLILSYVFPGDTSRIFTGAVSPILNGSNVWAATICDRMDVPAWAFEQANLLPPNGATIDYTAAVIPPPYTSLSGYDPVVGQLTWDSFGGSWSRLSGTTNSDLGRILAAVQRSFPPP